MYMGCSYPVQILFLHPLGPRTIHKNLKGFLFHYGQQANGMTDAQGQA